MPDVEFKTEDLLRRQIGEPGTPVQRVKEKNVRADVARCLKERSSAWPPEVRLRAYLAIGRVPDSELLSGAIIRRALPAKDCASFANLLAIRHTLLDADAALSALASLVISDRQIRVEPIASALVRNVTKWYAQRNRTPLDPASLHAYVDLLLTLLGRARESQERSPAKRDGLLLKLVRFAMLEGAEGSTLALQRRIVKLLTASQAVIESELSDALDEQPELRSACDRIVNGVLEQVRRMAISGKEEEFESFARDLVRLRLTEQKAQELLRSLHSDRGQLNGRVQRVLAELLGLKHELPPETDFEGGTAPSVQSMQLASALMRSWAAAGDSAPAKEAFDELSSVVGSFFGLHLNGQPGEVVEFNPVVHELTRSLDEKPSRVRIVRPRIETSGGPVTNVMIKALVEPV